ncbi:Uncharacterised protein [Serratia quinivorans]|nr:Uncharacterised protein [Serratia quinivorans]CAI0775866.1 Uncharacterised protein [Serratia quinivorans]CAI0934274.1 Uncharacterised protein [Serratia quinivorans]CAI1219303.1 Uncharacterised protein [Serratia quinivorans]CAI1528214.1 Uncharacterised protein [Serratia quinivorans]
MSSLQREIREGLLFFLSSPTKDFTISDPRSVIYSFELCTL